MKVLVAGAEGFIGRYLCWLLEKESHQVLVLSRHPSQGAALWDGASAGAWGQALESCDAVVNLAGAPIAEGRWTPQRKEVLIKSRLDSTKALVNALAGAKRRPKVFLSASAIGYYGDRKDELLDEASAGGDGFLAGLCRDWEREAQQASSSGVKTVVLRAGIVLGREGGALAKMLPPFRLCAGGPLGSGAQWMSWIAREDLAGLIVHLLEHEAQGPFNGVAPYARTNADFSAALGKALGRPSALRAPAFALRLALGEMASELLLASQKVAPKNALASGYRFQYPELEGALKACLL